MEQHHWDVWIFIEEAIKKERMSELYSGAQRYWSSQNQTDHQTCLTQEEQQFLLPGHYRSNKYIVFVQLGHTSGPYIIQKLILNNMIYLSLSAFENVQYYVTRLSPKSTLDIRSGTMGYSEMTSVVRPRLSLMGHLQSSTLRVKE